MRVAPLKNCTWVIVPPTSAAVAARANVAGANAVALFRGAVRLTVGKLLEIRVIGAEVVTSPLLSVALAVTV